MAGSPKGTGRQSGVLSADESVRHFLRYVGFPEEQLRRLIETCRHELADLEPVASRHGRKGYISLRLFLESLTLIVRSLYVPIRLPSKSGYDEHGHFKPTSLSRFARTMLGIAYSRGEKAFQRADLSPVERERAREKVSPDYLSKQ